MARLIPVLLLVLVAAMAGAGLGQPPGSPVSPASGTVPAPSATKTPEAPLARFEPLAAYPLPTQNAVRSVLLGSAWLTRMNQPNGRFLPGYRPAVRQPMTGEQDLAQARAALALAQSAKFAADERQIAVASQAVLTLLASTKIDAGDAECRVPVHSGLLCNRIGFAAILALAIYELPGADDKLVGEAERLCNFLRKQLRPDGSVDCSGNADAGNTDDRLLEYSGLAFQAFAVGNRVRPAAWKLEVLKKGLVHYRGEFKKIAHPVLAASLSPAFAELFRQSRVPEAAEAVFEMNDRLVDLQYAASDPRHPLWAGGFRGWAGGHPKEGEPGAECGVYVQSLADAYGLSRQGTDLARAARYRQALLDAVQFVLALQYVESNTRHFENTFRANMLIGGVHRTPTDGDLPIEATAQAVTGLLQFLSSGAEKN